MAAETEQFVPFRVAGESYGGSPRPRYDQLALKLGMAIADIFVEQALVDPDGKPLQPERFRMVSKYRPWAGNASIIHGITHSSRARRIPRAAYWGFRRQDLEQARFVHPQVLAEACAEKLRELVQGTDLSNGSSLLFRSVQPPIKYGELVVRTAEAADNHPSLPITTQSLAIYAMNVGGGFLYRATGDPQIGTVGLHMDEYEYVPKSQMLQRSPAPRPA